MWILIIKTVDSVESNIPLKAQVMILFQGETHLVLPSILQ